MSALPKEKRDSIVLVVLGTGILLAGIYYGLIDPQLKGLQTKGKRQDQASQKVQQAERLVKQAQKIQEDLLAAKVRLQECEAKMASGDYYTWSFKLMEQFMTTNQIKLLDASRPQETEVGLYADFPYKAMKFTMRASGFFHDFGRFLAAFENTYPHMRIQDLTLDSAHGSNDEIPEKLTIQFDVVALTKPVGTNL
jgi:hypothetical protein